MSLEELLAGGAARGGEIAVVDEAGRSTSTWAELHERAIAVGGALQAAGVGPGDCVALVARTSLDLVLAIRAVWLAGGCSLVSPLPGPRATPELVRQSLARRLDQADPVLVVPDERHRGLAEAAAGSRLVLPLAQLVSESAPREAPAVDGATPAVVQFTSGSTADPRGAVVTRGALTAYAGAHRAAFGLDPGDRLVSWLPLYHDLGLISGPFMAAAVGHDAVLCPTETFAGSPGSWCDLLAQERATCTIAPDFAYGVAARTLAGSRRLDLSRLRAAFDGGEQIRPANGRALGAAGERHGLSPGVLVPGYGLAEATLAVSLSPLERGLDLDHVDRGVLERERRADPVDPGAPAATALARLGPPLPGTEVRIVAGGVVADERAVGEVEVRSPSITPGYLGRPELADELFDDGWLRTGDLGYLAEGELVVCGREKDVIVLGGRNVQPDELEELAGAVEGVRRGSVIAFGLADETVERVVVVAEWRGGDVGKARSEIGRVLGRELGITPADVVLVEPGTAPKTSSGKLMRGAARDAYLAGRLG